MASDYIDDEGYTVVANPLHKTPEVGPPRYEQLTHINRAFSDHLSVADSTPSRNITKPARTAAQVELPQAAAPKRSCREKVPCWGWILLVFVGILIALLAVIIAILMTQGGDKEMRTQLPSTLPPDYVYKDCQEVLSYGMSYSGVYNVKPDAESKFAVFCDQTMNGGGWTVIQRRKDGSTDFDVSWASYQLGFGDLRKEFWIGNDYLHRLTRDRKHRLKIELKHPNGSVGYANYNSFFVDGEWNNYKLYVSGFTGNTPPGDSLTYHDGMMFSARDVDHDPSRGSCSRAYTGGWWYNTCHRAGPNGLYSTSLPGKGIIWLSWAGNTTSMKATRMMIKR